VRDGRAPEVRPEGRVLFVIQELRASGNFSSTNETPGTRFSFYLPGRVSAYILSVGRWTNRTHSRNRAYRSRLATRAKATTGWNVAGIRTVNRVTRVRPRRCRRRSQIEYNVRPICEPSTAQTCFAVANALISL